MGYDLTDEGGGEKEPSCKKLGGHATVCQPLNWENELNVSVNLDLRERSENPITQTSFLLFTADI